MDYAFCSDCKAKTQALWDRATGDIICTECALVLESHCVDQSGDWRTTFTDDSKDNDHPVLVGQPTTLLEKCVLSTVVTQPSNLTKSDSLPGSLARMQSLRPESDKSLVIACFNTISDLVDRLGLIILKL